MCISDHRTVRRGRRSKYPKDPGFEETGMAKLLPQFYYLSPYAGQRPPLPTLQHTQDTHHLQWPHTLDPEWERRL